jgi:site-specific recombinase XerD
MIRFFPWPLPAITLYDRRLGQNGGALGVPAKLGFKSHPHMLRHARGFQLANQGTDTRTLQAYLGHRNIQHTVRYTELSHTLREPLARLTTRGC